MLVKQLPSDIPSRWPMFKDAIRSALAHAPAARVDRMTCLLQGLLKGEATMWISFVADDKQNVRPVAVMITQITEDGLAGFRSVEIYALAASPNRIVDENIWVEGLERLRQYAAAEGAARIIAYSDVPRVIELAEKVGGNTSLRFITFPVEAIS